MNEQQTLKKLADLFHVAPSALRYWDNEGLIRFERSTDNNYRMPTWKTMPVSYTHLDVYKRQG